MNEKAPIPEDLQELRYKAIATRCHFDDPWPKECLTLISRIAALQAEVDALKRERDLLRMNHPFGPMYDALRKAQDENTALKAEVARLSAPVTDGDEEPDTCEGCEEPLRIDEGHETEDMVMLCDKCWQGLLDDPDCHSQECPCEKCILARATPPQDVENGGKGELSNDQRIRSYDGDVPLRPNQITW